MPTVFIAPTFGVGYQAFTTGGLPLNAGKIYTYIAGGTTPQATYTTSAGNVQNANPIILSADGRPPSEIWLTNASYRFDVCDSDGNLIKTYDNIAAPPSEYQLGTAGEATGAALVAFTQGTGATARTAQSKMRDFVSAYDAGALCDGSTDDYAALSAYVAANSNIIILFPPGSTTLVSQALPWKDNCGYACYGGWATIKAAASSTDNVIGNATSATYTNVFMANLIVDGNKSNCAYNTRNAGATDDNYQHCVRLRGVSNSVFDNVRTKNAVMSGWSLYGANTDNLFFDCWADDCGKTTAIISGSAAQRGIYMEVGASRNRWLRPRITNPKDAGIWQNSDTGTDADNEFLDAYLSDNGSCTGDGFVIEALGTCVINRTKFTGTVKGFSNVAGQRCGVHLIRTGGSGTINDCQIQAVVDGCYNGIVIGTGANRTQLISPNSRNNTAEGIAISTGAVDTQIIGGISLSNSTNYSDSATRTVLSGLIKDATGIPVFTFPTGTWTPIDSSGAGLSFSSVSAYYKNLGGGLAYVNFALTYPATASGADAVIGGMPFTAMNTTASSQGGSVTVTNLTIACTLFVASNSSVMGFYDFSGTRITNAQLSGKVIRGSALFITA